MKQIFLSTTKFLGEFATTTECLPSRRAWAEPSPKGFPLGAFMFVQRD